MPGRRTTVDMGRRIDRATEECRERLTEAAQQRANTHATIWTTMPLTTGAVGTTANPFVGYIVYGLDQMQRVRDAHTTPQIQINAKPTKEVQAKDDFDMDAGD